MTKPTLSRQRQPVAGTSGRKREVASLSRQKLQKGYEVELGAMSATEGGFFPGHVIGTQGQVWRTKGRMEREGAAWAQQRRTLLGPQCLRSLLKPTQKGPKVG